MSEHPILKRLNLEVLFAAFQALAVFLTITGFNPNPYLYDDNKSQWLPVTDFAIRELLAGTSPQWNPYILNGVRVDVVGYYGVSNPLMIASHLLSRAVGVSNTLSLYILLAFVIGSVVAHSLARRLGSCWLRASLLTLTYQLAFTNWSHGYWYYVFNNFLMFPVLLYVVQRYLDAVEPGERRRAAWGCGAAFGLAVGLGNIQYAAYQWCLVGVVAALPMFLSGRYCPEKPDLVRGGLLAALIAAPTCWMLADAGRPTGDTASSLPMPFSVAFEEYKDVLTGTRPPWFTFVGGLPLIAVVTLLCGVGYRFRNAAWANWLGGVAAVSLAVAFAGGWGVESIPVLNRFRYAFKWWFTVPPLLFYLGCLVPRLAATSILPIRWIEFPVLLAAVGVGALPIDRSWPVGWKDPNTRAVISDGRIRDLPPGLPDHHCPVTPRHDLGGFRDLAEQLDLANYRFLPATCGPDADSYRWHGFHTSQRYVERHLSANVPAELRAFSPVGYHIGLRPEIAAELVSLTRSGDTHVGAIVSLVEAAHMFELKELLPGGAKPGMHRLVPLDPLPNGFADMSDLEAERAVAGRRFAFVRPNGEVISDRLVLGPCGRIEGYDFPRERFWQVSRGKFFLNGWVLAENTAQWAERLARAGVRYLVLRNEEVDEAAAFLNRPDWWLPTAKTTAPWVGRIIRGSTFSAIELPAAIPLVTGPDGRAIPFSANANGVMIRDQRVPTGSVTFRFHYDPAFRATLVSADGKSVPAAAGPIPGWFTTVYVPPGDWVRLELRIADRRIWGAIVFNLFAVVLLATPNWRPRIGWSMWKLRIRGLARQATPV